MEFTESTELLFQPMKKVAINVHWKSISHVISLAYLLISFYNQTWILCTCFIYRNSNVDTFLISNFYLYHVGPEISHKKISIRRHLTPQKLSVRNRIVDIHNHFRAFVKPPAKNMLKMVKSYSQCTVGKFYNYNREIG